MKEKGVYHRLLHCLVFLLVLGLPVFGTAASEHEEEPSAFRGADRIGLIFNTPGILLELEPYQASGVGFKVFWDRLAVRALAGMLYERSGERVRLTAGASGEYHLIPHTVSPYVGGGFRFDYLHDELGPTSITSFESGLGPAFGVEFALHRRLSLFAEYTLFLQSTYTRSSTSDTTTEAWNHAFGTRLGNNGALGIVVYFYAPE